MEVAGIRNWDVNLIFQYDPLLEQISVLQPSSEHQTSYQI